MQCVRGCCIQTAATLKTCSCPSQKTSGDRTACAVLESCHIGMMRCSKCIHNYWEHTRWNVQSWILIFFLIHVYVKNLFCLSEQTIPNTTWDLWFDSCGAWTVFEYARKYNCRRNQLGICAWKTNTNSRDCYKKLMCISLLNVESIDDMKIVSYHWEEIKGPLREQKASADTAVLHLSNLVPGNYTFRYLHRHFPLEF